jgi:hypothetical protein
MMSLLFSKRRVDVFINVFEYEMENNLPIEYELEDRTWNMEQVHYSKRLLLIAMLIGVWEHTYV